MADLERLLQELRAERDRIDRVIQSILEFQDASKKATIPGPPPRSNRGRKSMNPEERQRVSTRMRIYWTQRRQAREIAALI